jgi:hypothetical protein
MRGGKTRFFKGKAHKAESAYIDPNSPSSPDYAERHRTVSYEIAPGMTRTDVGVPTS